MKSDVNYYEIECIKNIEKVLNQYGHYIITNTALLAKTSKYPYDLKTCKIINGSEYKIAIEIKNKISEPLVTGFSRLIEISPIINEVDKFILLTNSSNDKYFRKYIPDAIQSQFEIFNIDSFIKLIDSLEQKKDSYSISVQNFAKELIKIVNKDPENLYKLEWRELEKIIHEIFEKMGFKTTLTPCSKDGGKDIILECQIENNRKTYIIEIKHWKTKLYDKNLIKEFSQVIINEKHEKGIILATSGFGTEIYNLLTEKEPIYIGDERKILSLFKTYEKIENGIFNPISIEELEKNLFVDLYNKKKK